MVTVSLEDGSLPEGLLLESVCTDKISEETARVIYSGLRCLVGGALRQQKLKPEVKMKLKRTVINVYSRRHLRKIYHN